MSTFVLVLLGGIWAAVLLPGLLRDRGSSPAASINSFQRSMGRLAPGGVGSSFAPSYSAPSRNQMSPVRQRRAMALQRLGFTFGGTVLVGLVVGGWTWWLAFASGAALVGYVGVLRDIAVRERTRRARLAHRAEIREKVRRLPVREPVHAPARTVRRGYTPRHLEQRGA